MSDNFKVTGSGVEVRVTDPHGQIVAQSGPYAGLRIKFLGGTPIRGNTTVRMVHNEAPVPFMFDPAYAVNAQPAPDPEALRGFVAPVEAPAPAPAEIQGETFTKSTPTEANPFADIQVVEFDAEKPVEVDILATDTRTDEIDAAASPADVLEILRNRDIREFSLTPIEFNRLSLSKAQVWKLYEQVIGRTANKPSIQQAAASILKRANANAADYSRVLTAVGRMLESSL